ncbi:MAG TPA: ExeM/NucH family extracellular endonuclease [Pseudolysinimonas sp.]|nr:ExeM/NucH family extracellular endonuclease [Pseudolysinimonas sp.]
MKHLSALFAVSTATALAVTALVATPAVAAEPVPIAAVQGTGAATPMAGQTVTVQGVVTAYYGAPSNYRGLYLEAADPAAEGPAGASDGIFVFFNAANPAVSIGDEIQVTGTASEFQDQTQISATAAANYTVVQAGAGLPAAVALPDTVLGADREAYEGMLVQPSGTYVLASTHELYNFGSLWLSAGKPAITPTEVADAGSADAAAIAADNAARRILIDDGYSIRVDAAAHVGEQPYLTKNTVVRLGDTLVAPAKPMVLGYGFSQWRLQPQVPLTDASDAAYKPTFTSANPRPSAAPSVGGDVQFGSFNVFNYFTTLTSQNPDARGAATAAQLATQKSKIVSAINGLGADIVALEEVENSVAYGDPVDTALADLVSGLNAAAGAGTWAYVPTPAALATAGATDVITTAIIYKPAVAERVGDSFADTDDVWDIARKPVAQTFDVGHRIVTVVANHLKSKTPPANAGPEPADGQGFFNAERVAQAHRLVAWIADISADATKGDDVILLGDFNSYGQEDPVQVLTAAGLTDLVPQKAQGQYTYSFNGALGSLDHAFVTPSMAPAVTGVGVWGINSSEWGDRGYAFAATEAGTPFRSSDHDPVVVGFDTAMVPVTIDLLSINDFHGRLEAIAPAGGAAVLSGVVKKYRAANPNTAFVAAGDLIGASTFTSFIQQDQPTIDAFNAMGLDASSFGNHEFDQGRADVDDRILPEADWPYLAANLYDKSTGKPAFQEYELKQYDGVTVGFIGAVTEDLPTLVSPAGIATLDVKPVVSEVNRVAGELTDGNAANGEADVLVLLVHEGAATPALASSTDDSRFGRIVMGADPHIQMIISGHTHLAYDHEIPIPGTNDTRLVISSGQYGEKFAHTVLKVDPETGDLISADAEILNLPGAADPDPVVAAIVADAVAKAAVLGNVALGTITQDITRAKQSGGSENRGGESTIGNLIADAQLAATQDLGTQLALMNPGGIRTDLLKASTGAGDPEGSVNYREAATVQPFANTLTTIDLTGAQLKAVLEQQWQPAGSARPFLKLGVSDGFSYTYDPAAAAGSHITAMYLGGVKVTPDQVIHVVTNSFLAAGGDAFTAFTQGTNKADSGRIDLDAFVDYIKQNSPVSPDLAQRAVGVTLSAPADGVAYTAGESVTLTLSSLLFSNGGPAGGNAEVSLGGTTLGSAAIDPAIVDTTDEQGRATVTITIPDGVSGPQTLTVTAPGGTSVAVPIVVAVPVEPVRTTAYGAPNRIVSFGGRNVEYTARVVAADGSEPVGTVTVYDGRTAIATIELGAGDHGRDSVKLPKLTRGVHLLTATFAGDGFVNSRSWPSLVVVI